jgi:hypothetical protein
MTTTTTQMASILLKDMLLNKSWSCTDQEASIGKVLVGLADNTFFETIEKEKGNPYNQAFKKAYEKWRSVDGSADYEDTLSNALEILRKDEYRWLVDNFCILEEYGIPSKIRRWCHGSSKSYRIKAIHQVSTFSIIESQDDKFHLDNHVFESIDEALVHAIVVKYDNQDSRATRLICKMLGIGDWE